jgi:hypothetical protein
MTQIWNIGGRSYNWAQLQELKKRNLDPKTVVTKFEAPKPEDKQEVSIKPEESKSMALPTNFMELKSLAKSQGMEVTNGTKKEEILTFLASLKQ